MSNDRSPRFRNLFSPERRSARKDRWSKRFRKFSLSTWQSNRIVESVCSVFRAGAETARLVREATGTQMVTALASRSLRLEGLEERQMLTTTPWDLSAGNFSQDWSNAGLITTDDSWAGVQSITGYLGDVTPDLTAGVNPQTQLGPGSGAVDVIANQNNPNGLTNGGVAEFQASAPMSFTDNFDSYADQAAFQAAWPVVGTQPTATWSNAQSVSPSRSVHIPTSTTTATSPRNTRSFSETGTLGVGDQIVFSFDFYDEAPAASPYRQHVNLQDGAVSGTNQLVAMGLNNNQTSTQSGGQRYMGRILGYTPVTGADPDGGPDETQGSPVVANTSGMFFKLNDFGTAGTRSLGWHNLKVVLTTDDGLSTDYAFYVDNVLAERVSNVGTAASLRSYENFRIGSGVSSTQGAYYDNMNVEFIPGPVNAVVALQGSGGADAPSLNLFMNSEGRDNVTISYNVRDMDGSPDHTNQQVALQYRIGNTGDFIDVPAGYILDATTGPSDASSVTPISVSLAAWNNQSDLQIRILTTNATSSDEWVGIDDITVTSMPNATPEASNQNLGSFNEDVSGISGTLSATDADFDTLTYAIASQPTKGTITAFDAATGAFTYVPNAHANGADSFTFKANDGSVDSNVATISLTLTPVNDAPVAIAQSLSTNKNAALNGTLTGTDADNDTLTYTLTGFPEHGNITLFDSSTGAFTYEPNPNYVGPDSFEFRANDAGSGLSALISIDVVNAPPTITNDTSPSINENTTSVATLTATDPGVPASTITFSITGGADQSVFTITAGNQLEFLSAPNFESPSDADLNNVYEVQVTADDGEGGQDVETFLVTVGNVNEAPVIGGDVSGDVTEDGTLVDSGALTVTDPDAGESMFQAVGAATTYGNYTLDATGNWSYTLDNNNVAVQGLLTGGSLSDSFTAVSADGTTQLVTITINGADDLAIIGGDMSGAVSEDGTLVDNGTLTISDPDAGQETFVGAGATLAYGSYTLDAAGNWTYTLDNTSAAVQGLITGGTLSDSFTAVSADGTSQLVTITIHGADDSAIIGGSTIGEVSEDGALVDSGALTISDPDAGQAAFQAAGAATTYGSYTLDAAGNWTYTLDNTSVAVQGLLTGGTLSDSFTAVSAGGATQLVTITIHGDDDPTVIGGDTTGAVSEDGTLVDSGALTISDPDVGQATFVAAGAALAYGSYTLDAAGNWSYTLDNNNSAVQNLNTGGTLSDSFTAVSAGGVTQLVSITIQGLDEPSTAVILNGDANDNQLVIDLAAGTYSLDGDTQPLAGINDITFFAGDGQDSIVITGGTFGTTVYDYTNATDGDIDLGNGLTIHYFDLDPISNDGTAASAVFNLPATGDNATVTNSGGSLNVSSSPTSFETTTIAEPSSSLTVNTGGGDDTLNVQPSNDYTVSVDGGGHVGGDTLTVDANGAYAIAVAGEIRVQGFANIAHSNFETIVIQNAAAATTTLYVDDNWIGTAPGADPDGLGPAINFGVDAFATIQGAINAAATSGSSILVYAGAYNEALSIVGKSLSIEDVDGDGTVDVNAGLAANGVDVLPGAGSISVSIDGIDFSGASSNGIHVGRSGANVAGLTLTNSSVAGGLTGVWVDGGTLDMQSTIVTGAAIFGVQVGADGDADISNSEISGASTSTGVIVSDGHADIVESKLSGNSRGLLVNATGTASVTGSDLSGNSIGGVVNATATLVDASGNWWGSNSETAVDAAAIGAVDFSPYLDAGTDSDGGARGFVGDHSYLHVTALGGQTGGSRIDEAVDLIADGTLTGGSRVVDVHAGAYAGQVVIDKSLTLSGAQAGVDARGRAVPAGQESTIAANAAVDALIEVSASGVTIDGFTVDGADLAFRALRVNGVDSAVVENNIITGGVRGVQYNGAAAGNTGGLVSQNRIEDFTVGAGESYGVMAFDASYASVVNNDVTADVGVFEQYFYQPNGGGNAANVISGNEFNAALLGYGTNERAANAATTALSGNVYNIGTGGTGVQLYNIYKTGGITLTNETITGADVGVFAFVSGGSASISGGSIAGTDAAGSVGVHVTNYLTAFAFAATGDGGVTIDGVDISDFATGVHVEDDALGAFDVSATITNGTDISSSVTGIRVSGADASVDANNGNAISGNTVGIEVAGGTANIANNDIDNNGVGVSVSGGTATLAGNALAGNTTGVSVSGTGVLTVGSGNSISGGTTGLLLSGPSVGLTGLSFGDIAIDASGDYITLAGSAFDNLDLDATGTTLGGVAVASMTAAQKLAASNKITDEIDNNTLGLVLLATNTIFVTPATTPTALDNDYTRIKNAIEAAGDNWTIDLLGTFNWTEANAAASWALGNDGLAATDDDYSILVAGGLEGVTLTASTGLGSATIQGPGDLATVNLEGFLYFPGGATAADDNKNWTISNLEILDFDLGIGMFNSAAGVDAFDGTTILNNRIRIATDLNATVAPMDVNQNIGIHYSFGANQTIQGNFIDIPGTGVSDSANSLFASTVGMQSNTSGGAVYDGLLIDDNTITVTGAQSANPENILGIWENGHAHTSDVTVSNNDFINAHAGNDPTLNLQRAFRVTSHSGASSTVSYSGNIVVGANTGFQWLAGSNFAGNQAVQLLGNSLTNVNTGMLIQSNGVANINGNTLVNGGAMAGVGTGVDVISGSAAITGNQIRGQNVGVRLTTGGGGSVDGNNFDGVSDSGTDVLITSTAGAVTSLSGNSFAGDTFYIDNQSTQSFDLSANGTTFDETSNFRIEDKMHHRMDADLPLSTGLVTWIANNVYVTAPGVGSTDSSIQRGVDVVSAGGAVNVEAGTFAESVTIGKTIGLIGAVDGGGVAQTTLTPAGPATSLVEIAGTSATDDVTIANINFDGLAGTAGYGVRVGNATDLDTLSISNGSFTGLNLNATAVFGDVVTGISAQNVELTNLSFSGNGLGGGGGTGDVQFFEYNGDATLTDLTLVGSATATSGARLGIQFRGTGGAAGAGAQAMGDVTLDGVDVSGDYRTQMIGIQRYSDASGLTFTDVALGGVTSAITGGFGASLRFDAVGVGSIGAPASVDLGNTLFRGLDPLSAQRHEIEIAPDNAHTFLRADGTATTWTIGGVDVAASSLTSAHAFAVEDRILHYVDKLNPVHGTYKGFVDIQTGQAFIGDDADAGVVGDGSIQRGIDIVAAGGTVNVEAGQFSEEVSITKNVQLRGAQAGVDPELRDLGNLAAETTLSLSGAGDIAFQVGSGLTDVTINGFNVTGNGTAQNAIVGSGHSGLKVLNNFIHDFTAVAVAIETGTTGALVQYNDIFNSYVGVYLSTGASSHAVRDNYIHGSTSSEGDVTLEGDNANVTIRNNTFDSPVTAGVYAWTGFGDNFAGTSIVENAFLGANGVNNTNASALNAAGNWWGSVYGPTSPSNPWTGVQPTGATVSGNVNFTPWLTDGTDTALNVSGFQPNALDAVAPAGTTPDLSASSDTGNPTDNVTSDNTPTFVGSAEANSLVLVGVWVDTALNPGMVDDGEVTVVASDEADGAGAWAATLPTTADGTYQIVARVVDQAGNSSDWSAPLSVTIDSAIATTTLDLLASSDSTSPFTSPPGTNTDDITNINTPTFVGMAEAGSTVQLFEGVALRGTTVANGSGMWSITLGVALPDGAHTLTAKSTDLAGNTSVSTPLTVTIDTFGQVSSTPDMTPGTDHGNSTSDNVTNDNTPTFTGSAEAGSFVELLLDGTTVLQSANAVGGTWTITAGIAIPNGAHAISARVTDIAGNVSVSGALSITIDTVMPSANGGPDVIVGAGDSVTLIGSASDAGTGVGSTLWQFVSSTNGQVVPDSAGTLTFTPTSPGSYTFNYVVSDVAGNVTIDTVVVSATFTADFDLDGDVDGADLAAWQSGFATTPPATVAEGDENRDVDVDGFDFLAWQRQRGSMVPATPAATAAGEAVSLSASSASLASSYDANVAAVEVADSAAAAFSFQQPSSWWLDPPASSMTRSESSQSKAQYEAAFDAWAKEAELDDAPAPALAKASGSTAESLVAEGEESVDEAFAAYDDVFGVAHSM